MPTGPTLIDDLEAGAYSIGVPAVFFSNAAQSMMITNGVSPIYPRDRGFRRVDGIRVADPAG